MSQPSEWHHDPHMTSRTSGVGSVAREGLAQAGGDEPQGRPQRPLRIAMDAQCLQTARTGVRTYVNELVAAFERLAIPHQLVLLPGPRGLPRTHRLFRILNQIRYMTWLHIGLPLRMARKDFDVLWSPEYLTPVWCPIPRVVTYHDSFFLRRPQDYNRWWQLMYRRVTVPAIRRAGAIVVPSHYAKDEAVEYAALPPERTYVTPLGGPAPGSMRVDERLAAAALSRLGVAPRRYLLHVGVLERRKNLVTLVRAFDAWQRQGGPGAGFKLVLVGQVGPRPDLDDAPAIQAEIEQRGLGGSVILAGHLPKDAVYALYTHAAAVVIASKSEGFGLPILECFAAGVPLVCSTAASLPEVAGNAALMFDPDSPEQLVTCLNRLGSDPALRAALVQAGNERARLFTWDATATATMRAFQAAATSRRGSKVSAQPARSQRPGSRGNDKSPFQATTH